MIKKIISISLLVFILCGCENSRLFIKQGNNTPDALASLGYENATIKMIRNLSKEHQTLFENKYDEKLNSLIIDIDFKEENLDEYLKYDFDIQTLLYLVNEKIINNDNYILIKNLMNDEWFIFDNLENYLNYYQDFKDARLTVEYVNASAYKKPYEDYKDSDLTMSNLIIANKYNYLGEYIPENLVDVDKDYSLVKNLQLQEEAYEAFKQMANAAKEEKCNLYILSAYRSYQVQVDLYNRYLEKDSQALVDTYSSRAGFSDHQTGLTVDILNNKDGVLDAFKNTNAAKWLAENAYKYGFILRYPQGKEKVTGYMYESWHYRYVGLDVANYIQQKGITFDEYYAYFVENQTQQ